MGRNWLFGCNGLALDELQLEVAAEEDVPELEGVLLDALSLIERAVGATEVIDLVLGPREHHLAVPPGHGAVLRADAALFGPSDLHDRALGIDGHLIRCAIVPGELQDRHAPSQPLIVRSSLCAIPGPNGRAPAVTGRHSTSSRTKKTLHQWRRAKLTRRPRVGKRTPDGWRKVNIIFIIRRWICGDQRTGCQC